MAEESKSTSTCYLVRHGQRLDAVDTFEDWFRENPHRYPLDPPLTKRGSKMANISANKFKKNHDVTLSCVYTSPLHRAFMTAYEFAKILELPLIIVPGLACAAACKQFGPIITKSDGTMALKKKIYGRKGLIENVFLTLEEVQAMCPDVEVSMRTDLMGGRALEEFEKVIYALAKESNPILVVAHREGIYHFFDELNREIQKALYCQTVRLDLDVQNGKPLDVEIDYKGLLV